MLNSLTLSSHMTKRNVFLDIDGVLNVLGHKATPLENGLSDKAAILVSYLDKNKVKALNNTLLSIKANVVIMSATYGYYSKEEMIEALKHCGLNVEIDFVKRDFDAIDKRAEILNYINENKINDFVILDDRDFGFFTTPILKHRHCQPDSNVGLTDKDLKNLMNIFSFSNLKK
jgi:hypothetical protein